MQDQTPRSQRARSRAEPDSRGGVVAVLASACFLLVACRATGEERSPATTRALPNVVVLYTDDQGYGDCSALNPAAGFRTPHMDRLAREGAVFTDAHSAGSVCTPSRYALLTGRYAWRTRRGGGVLGADADCLIEDGRTTLASLLREAGYATALFGKWHLGLQIPGTKGERDWSLPVTDGPLQKGFDRFYGIPASMNFGVLTWFDQDRAIEPASLWTRKKFPAAEITTPPLDYAMRPPYDAEPEGPKDVEVAPGFRDEDALRIMTEHAVAFIEEQGGRPFFLTLAFTSPHLPHCTAPEFRGTSGMGNYGDFLVETDHRVGQVLAALDAAGLAEDTLVVLTSDNGPENNYHDWSRIYGHASNGGFRGGKRDVYEGGHRVPFLLRWPARVPAGRVVDEPVGQVDLLATVAELVGADVPDGHAEDGTSFLSLLDGSGDEGERANRPPLIHHGRGRFAIRSGSWKLIFAKGEGRRTLGAPAELYDLDRDPAETVNRLDAEPALVRALHEAARASVEQGG